MRGTFYPRSAALLRRSNESFLEAATDPSATALTLRLHDPQIEVMLGQAGVAEARLALVPARAEPLL